MRNSNEFSVLKYISVETDNIVIYDSDKNIILSEKNMESKVLLSKSIYFVLYFINNYLKRLKTY